MADDLERLPETTAELERIVQQRIDRYTQNKLVNDVKHIVNGLEDRVATVERELSDLNFRYEERIKRVGQAGDDLVAIHMQKEDWVELRDMIDQRRQERERKKFHQTLFGQVVIAAGVSIAALQLVLQLYTVFIGSAHPLGH